MVTCSISQGWWHFPLKSNTSRRRSYIERLTRGFDIDDNHGVCETNILVDYGACYLKTWDHYNGLYTDWPSLTLS